MSRADLIRSLKAVPEFDLAVVGGGATGLGVALDAALRGFSVVLLESHDFAGGTSSRSTKLLHGGVRYLARGQLSLVREALHERSTVLSLAPHLAQPLAFVMPSYRWWQTPFYGLGLKLYDALAGSAGLGATRWLNARQVAEALPGVQTEGLRGGVMYWDGQFDDARLALALARTVEAAGGLPLNHLAVTAVRPLASPESGGSGDARFELTACDRRDGDRLHTIRARAVVNATGVWVDALRQAAHQGAQPSCKRLVTASQGVHVVVDRSFLPGPNALLVPRTRDGRVLFAVPWLGSVILGTTDTPREDLPREPQPFDEELNFILSEASQVLSRPVRREDIRSQWVGLRPLVSASSGRGQTQALSREHTVVTDPQGLISVTGGKWTTYRAMAKDVMQACVAAGVLPDRPGPGTDRHRLVGASNAGASRALQEAPGWHLYGGEASRVRACGAADRELGLGLTEAMVRFAARHEYAWTVEDVLARRWRALFLDAARAADMAPSVAEIMRVETGDDPRLGEFLSLCQGYRPKPSRG